MKIDTLIKVLGQEADEAIIIINKETITSLFDELNNTSRCYGTWENPNPIHIGARGVCRGGMTIHFVDSENVRDINFKKI